MRNELITILSVVLNISKKPPNERFFLFDRNYNHLPAYNKHFKDMFVYI